MVSTIVIGILSAVVANYARNKDYTHARTFAGVVIAIVIVLVLLVLFLIIKSHLSPAGELENFAFGVIIALIILILSLIGIGVMMAITIAAINDKNSDRALEFAAGSSALAFGTFVLSLLIVIFLL